MAGITIPCPHCLNTFKLNKLPKSSREMVCPHCQKSVKIPAAADQDLDLDFVREQHVVQPSADGEFFSLPEPEKHDPAATPDPFREFGKKQKSEKKKVYRPKEDRLVLMVVLGAALFLLVCSAWLVFWLNSGESPQKPVANKNEIPQVPAAKPAAAQVPAGPPAAEVRPAQTKPAGNPYGIEVSSPPHPEGNSPLRAPTPSSSTTQNPLAPKAAPGPNPYGMQLQPGDSPINNTPKSTP